MFSATALMRAYRDISTKLFFRYHLSPEAEQTESLEINLHLVDTWFNLNFFKEYMLNGEIRASKENGFGFWFWVGFFITAVQLHKALSITLFCTFCSL